MANDTHALQSEDHEQRLADLRADRQNLATKMGGPGWLAPGLGLVAAIVVAGPAAGDGQWRNIMLAGAMAAGIVLTSSFHSRTGIKPSRVGMRAAGIYAGALGLTLVLLSVSFGLAAGGMNWWIAVTALVALVLVTWLVQLFVAATRDHLSHGS